LKVVLQSVVSHDNTLEEGEEGSEVLQKTFMSVFEDVFSTTNSTEFAKALKDTAEVMMVNSTSFDSVEVEFGGYLLTVEEIFMKSSEPSAYPTSAPTDIWSNAKLQNAENTGTFNLQFGWIIGSCVFIFTIMPCGIFFYRKRGSLFVV
jgi:hypothetical protein